MKLLKPILLNEKCTFLMWKTFFSVFQLPEFATNLRYEC